MKTKLEKGLMITAIQITCELNILNQVKDKTSKGKIYTSFSESDKTIKIGYSKNIYKTWSDEQKIGYRIIAKREGSIREKSILDETLRELGYRAKYKEGCYEYSERLMRHLDILGWPSGNLY